MASSILYLAPRDWRREPPPVEPLVAALTAAQVISHPLPFAGRIHYRPGERFLQSVTFLGCSPVVALGEPGATGDEFCHVEFESHAAPLLVTGEITRPPRCPACRKPLEGWPALAAGWRADPFGHRAPCPACGALHNGADLEWRQVAGAGRLFVKVWGVFEGEAVPGDELLALLEGVSGGRWGHFYFRG